MNKIITNYCYDSIVDKIRSFLNLSASLQQISKLTTNQQAYNKSASLQQDQAIFFKYI